jgi:N-acetylmuramoyl-L-alanine amidase/beta-lactamase regulating signal transducer with metallopeptidase domain
MNFLHALPAVVLHGAIFVSAAFLAWLCFRRQSAARLAAGGRMIMAAALLLMAGEASVAVWNARAPEIAARVPATEPPLPSQPGGVSAVLLDTETAPQIKVPPSGARFVEVEPPAGPRLWEIPAIAILPATILWLAGALLVLARWSLALRARRKLARGASPVADAEWLALLRQLPGGNDVKLLRHASVVVPCAWRRTILLPANADDWPPAQRRMVLAHECAHLRRRDPLWLAVSQWFLALQWFNPFAWCVVRRGRAASERAADDVVLADTQDAPAYADLLVVCARIRCGAQPAICGMASPSTVGQRVERVLDETTDRRPCSVAWQFAMTALSLLVIAGVIALTPGITVAQTPEPPPENPAEPGLPAETGPPPATDHGAALKRSLQTAVVKEVNWAETPLLDALIELKQQTGVNFILRTPGPPKKNLTLHLRDVPLREVISIICEAAGMQSDPQETAVLITPAGTAPRVTTMTYRLPEKLATGLTGNDSAKQMLEQAGIQFPEGATAAFEPKSARLIVRNTARENERIARWIESGKADAPFDWQPVMMDGRGYVSADKVWRFYGFTRLQTEGEAKSIKLVFHSPALQMSWSQGAQEIQINEVKFGLQLPLKQQADTLWISRTDLTWTLEPVLRPKFPAEQPPLDTVVIDPGHGGEDIGVMGLRGMEKIYTLDTAQMLQRKLEAAGWRVILTRETDDAFVPRPGRVAIANRHPNAVFLSIHYNAHTPEKRGLETYVLRPSRATPGAEPEEGMTGLRSRSVALATAVHTHCVRQLEMPDGGLKTSSLEVLAGLQIPGILVEGGYLSNVEDAARIADANHRDKFADAILQGLENYRRALTPQLLPAPAPATNPPAAEKDETTAPDKIELEPEPEPETESPKSAGGFQWRMQTIGEREYISAQSVRRFYEFPRAEDKEGRLEMRSAKLVLRLQKDSSEMRINGVKFVLLHPVLEHEGALWISRQDLSWMLHPIIKPSHIENARVPDTVVIDPGHGGADAGNAGAEAKESFYTLDTAHRLKTRLEHLGFKVVMTRTEDIAVSREQRAAIANAHPNAVLLSLHFNSGPVERDGLETSLLTPSVSTAAKPPEDEADQLRSQSIALATALHANSLYKLRMSDGGVRGEPVDALPGVKIPAVHIEGRYLSNAAEAARIAKPEYRQSLAEALAGGLQNYRKALLSRARSNRDKVPQREE